MSGKLFAFLCPLLLLIMASCSLSPDQLQSAEKLMQSRPDSALHILQSVRTIQLINPADKALYSLLLSQAYDRNQIIITSDSIISEAIHYYGSHQPERAGASWLYAARCARNRGNAKYQASSLLKAQEYAELTTNYKLQALIYCDKADMYQNQGQLDSSILLNKKGLKAFVKCSDLTNICLTANTLGVEYATQKKADSCLRYFSMAEKLSIRLQRNDLLSAIYKGMGNYMFATGNIAQAIGYYKKAPVTSIPYYDDNRLYLISNAFLKNNQLDSARWYLSKISQPQSMLVEYYSILKAISKGKGHTAEEISYADQLIQAKDTFYSHQLQVSFAGIERQYKYNQLNEQNIELKLESVQKTSLLLFILLFASIALILILVWMLRINKRKLTLERQMNEQEKVLLQQANENSLLLAKQLETERQLNEHILALNNKTIENNELLELQSNMQSQLLQYIEQYRLGAAKGNMGLASKIQDVHIRTTIITYVDSKYKNVSQRLKNNFAAISDADVYVCCMLLAGFTTGMIATILNLKNDSINTQRTRIRRKLNLTSDQDLIDFLANL